MDKTIVALLTVFALSTSVFAGFSGQGETSRIVAVKSISDMSDDAEVTLEGYLVKQLLYSPI